MSTTYVKIINNPRRGRSSGRLYTLLFKRAYELRRWPLAALDGHRPDFATRREAREWVEDRPGLVLVSAWHEADEIKVTPCEAQGCDADKCANCKGRLPIEHPVVWHGPAGWAVCGDKCAEDFSKKL